MFELTLWRSNFCAFIARAIIKTMSLRIYLMQMNDLSCLMFSLKFKWRILCIETVTQKTCTNMYESILYWLMHAAERHMDDIQFIYLINKLTIYRIFQRKSMKMCCHIKFWRFLSSGQFLSLPLFGFCFEAFRKIFMVNSCPLAIADFKGSK